jgi:4'-phosphopantetheinyl transferase
LGKIVGPDKEAERSAASSSLNLYNMGAMNPHPRDYVDCWCISAKELSRQDESLAATLLSAEERGRVASFYFEHDRRCYLAAHAALRLLIARYTGESPRSVAIGNDAYGRPVLANSEWHFNLSHSGSLVLIAFSSTTPVGVDVEEIREIPDLMGIARSHFSTPEIEAINCLPPTQRTAAFFVIWTRKEAFVKAIGRGLSFPLRSFGTGLPQQPPYLTDQHARIYADWTLADVRPDERHLGAVAVHRPNIPINCRRADWQWLLRNQSTSRPHPHLAADGSFEDISLVTE